MAEGRIRQAYTARGAEISGWLGTEKTILEGSIGLLLGRKKLIRVLFSPSFGSGLGSGRSFSL